MRRKSSVTRKLNTIKQLTLASILFGSVGISFQALSQESKVFVDAPAAFRDIKMHTWKGLLRIGELDTLGLESPSIGGQTWRLEMQKNPELTAQLGNSMEQHNYSLGLLARLDYMRTYKGCFTNLNQYEARVERCENTLIQHSFQQQPWRNYIRHMGLALTPVEHGKLFCPHGDGLPVCGNLAIDRLSIKDENGRTVRMDEFQRRDFFSTLMQTHQAGFDQFWKQSVFPKQAWSVQAVTLSEYDFNKQQYVFDISPRNLMLNRHLVAPPVVAGKPNPKGVITARSIAPTFTYKALLPFEKESSLESGYRQQVVFPMAPGPARTLGQSNQTRIFYAVSKVEFLPRTPPTDSQPVASASSLQFHYPTNKVELYRDSALTQKVAELPINANFTDSTSDNKSNSGLEKALWANGHTILDGRAFALLRLQQGPLLDDILQRTADNIASAERYLWKKHQSRLQELEREYPEPKNAKQQKQFADRKHSAEDRSQISHVSWQTVEANRKSDLFAYMLGDADNKNAWPEKFPNVEWGMNLATIFKRGHFSMDPSLAHIPATEKDKVVVAQFHKEIAASFPHDKFTLVYGLRDARYDNQTEKLSFKNWPFHERQYIAFDDNIDKKPDSAGWPLIHSSAKSSRVIYPFTASSASFDGHVPNPPVSRCARNDKWQSEDCLIMYGNFLDMNWPAASFALDRELPVPTIKLNNVQGNKLLNNNVRGESGWRLVVEFENVDMKVSPYTYTHRQNREQMQGEAQTVFASVKNAYVISPKDEIVWRASASELKPPPNRATLVPAKEDKPFRWSESVSIPKEGQPDGVIYDFLYAKYYPQNLSSRMLEAMLSSRWQYEKTANNPVGGRFFNTDARTPTSAEVQDLIPKFKEWLLKLAMTMPAKLKVIVPVRYANDTMKESNQCVKLKLTPKSPLRNNSTAQILANNKVRQCENEARQEQNKFNQCNDLRDKLSHAEKSLASAKAEGCEREVAISGSAAKVDSNGTCDFSNVDFSNMQAQAQACIVERCGENPTSLNELAGFQQCVQAVSSQMQQQLAAAMGGVNIGKANSSAKAKVVNHCRPHEQTIRNAQSSIKSYRCDQYLTQPVTPDCSVLGEVKKASHMHVDRMLFKHNSYCVSDPAYERKSNSSATLLPNFRPYSDTQLGLELFFSEIKLPYDPPGNVSTPVNAVVELDATVVGVNEDSRQSTIKLNVNILGSRVVVK